MRWAFRIFLFLGFFGLAFLAVWPHVPAIKKEANLLYQAWQKVRDEEPAKVDTSVAEEAPKSEAPRRQILTPTTIDGSLPELTPSEDPFIMEARQRAQEDPEAAMQWLQSQSSGSERLRGMLEVVALWAAEDSQSALLWLESNAQGLARLETLSSGIELWADQNPTDAAAWIDGMANDGSKVTAAKSLAAKWVLTQPGEASAWVAGLPAGPLRDKASTALADAWVKVDPQAAAVWAFSEAEFNGNTALLESTIKTFTKQSPDEAEAFLRDMAEVTDAPTVLTNHVLARAEQDPAATAAWLSKMSPSDPIYSAEYANGLMQVWAESDSIAASEWLSQQPAGEQRDAAIYGFSESIQRYEPEAAAAWANTIDHPDRRMTRLIDSVRIWAQTDPEAAQEWVNTAELEPAVRQMLSRNSSDNLANEAVETPMVRLEDM
jgi:hypothetical protein